MKIDEQYIYLENVVFYSFHGVGLQERKVGNEFTINLRLKVDMGKAMTTDDVQDTVSYADVYQHVSEEMAVPSNLLEHACGRIINRIFTTFDTVSEIHIKLSKRNPPMGADIDSAGVEIKCRRD